MELLLVDHPLSRARLTTMRDERTDNAAFRAALSDLTVMLIYEATRDAALAETQIRTPMAATTGYRLAEPPLLVPVLRAGLGMAEAAFGLMPEARMGFVGVARDEHTHNPVPYMESLRGYPVFVLDPMLATGGSMAYTLELLANRGATDVTVICVLAAPEGVARLEEMANLQGLPTRVVTAAVDERLNETAFIIPGLGDAGDRQFGRV